MTQKRPLARDASEWALYADTSPFPSSRRIPPLRTRLDVPARPLSPPHHQLLSGRVTQRETNRPPMNGTPSPSHRIPTQWGTLPSKHLTGRFVSSKVRIAEIRPMHTTLRDLTTPHRRFPRSSSILTGWPQLSTVHSKVIKYLKATPLWYLTTLYPDHLFSSEASNLLLIGRDILGRRPNSSTSRPSNVALHTDIHGANGFTPDHAISAGVGDDSGQPEAMKCSGLKCVETVEIM
ncbi:hypothetical protein B0H14DRAFT_2611796 [Mycena olivaceomarginata]|nr:hypothetical protein B0H14DRAFT_2611796 [Mycena olivaceomarginata]